MSFISRGFQGRPRPDVDPARVPPGQYVTDDFPVLSAGPTPRTALDEWTFVLRGAIDAPRTWTWEELHALPTEQFTVDIRCVTKWSKLSTTWTGISVATLLEGVLPEGAYVSAFCDGGYTTNVALADLTGGQAFVAAGFEGAPLAPEHGGPARLVVPHLYFWKSTKWLCGLQITVQDQPGYWENAGYHNHADPWKEQRYWND